MSHGGTHTDTRRGSWRAAVDEDNLSGGMATSGGAVAFVPPSQDQGKGSISSGSDCGSLGMYSDDEESLPYPGFLAVTWGCLYQNSTPRSQCLTMITNPYPFIYSITHIILILNTFQGQKRTKSYKRPLYLTGYSIQKTIFLFIKVSTKT